MPVGTEDDNTVGEDVTFSSGTPGTSNAFPDRAHLVRVNADADCRLAFGENPSVAAGSLLLTAGCPEYFEVRPGNKVNVETLA